MKKKIVMFAAAAAVVTAAVVGTNASASGTNIIDPNSLQSKGLVSNGSLKVIDPSKGWDVNIQSSDIAKLGADINTITNAINNLGAGTTQSIDQLKQQVDNDLTAKLDEVNKNLADTKTGLTNDLNDEKAAREEALNSEKSTREKIDNEIYKILGMSNTSGEVDENGNAIERDSEGNITRIIKTETTVNGTVITVTRYDISKDPAEKIDEVSFDTATGKATTKEGAVVNPIIEPNVPAAGQTTVTIVNEDKTKTTIVYTNDTTVSDIEQYIKDHFGFTDSQLQDMRDLINAAMSAGASTKQDIINYVTNHTVTQEEMNTLIEGLNAPSTDNEVGVTMDEVKAYLESLGYTADQINNVVNKYLTMAGLTEDEIRAITSAMNDPAADLNSDGLVTKEELIAYLNSLTDASGNPLYTAEEIARLAAAYINLPSSSEINNTYKVFNTTEVTNISNAVTETYDDTALRTQVQNVADSQLSILDKIALEQQERTQAINNLSTDVDSRISNLSTDVDGRLNDLNQTVNTDLKDYINHGGSDVTYDGVRAKYTPKSGDKPATVTFSPIKTN